eukprot:2895600-Pyramimonas_sp.AAC.1
MDLAGCLDSFHRPPGDGPSRATKRTTAAVLRARFAPPRVAPTKSSATSEEAESLPRRRPGRANRKLSQRFGNL